MRCTVSLRQMVSMGWREFFKRSTTPRAESSRKMWLSVGQQVIFGGGAYGFNQTPAKFSLEEANDPANFLERESTLAQFADDGNFGQVVERIDAIDGRRGQEQRCRARPTTEVDAG